MTTMAGVDFIRAQDHIETLVMDNSFTVHHDVDSIVREFWEIFGHFDWEIIAHDTDQYWQLINKHQL